MNVKRVSITILVAIVTLALPFIGAWLAGNNFDELFQRGPLLAGCTVIGISCSAIMSLYVQVWFD